MQMWEAVCCDSAEMMRPAVWLVNSRFDVGFLSFFLPTTITADNISGYPAHKRHWFKLQPRQRESRAPGWSHTLTLSGAEAARGAYTHTHGASERLGILHCFFTCMNRNRRPPRDLKMWTEVGKLVLLHLLLMELHCAKGKRLASQRGGGRGGGFLIALRTAALRGSVCERLVCHRSPRLHQRRANITQLHAMALTWIDTSVRAVNAITGGMRWR